MKKLLIFLSFLVLAGCETASEQRQIVWKQILDGNCSSAESIAMQNFSGEYLNWWYGTIQLHCRKDRGKAIEFFRAGARANAQFSDLSVKSLIELGEKPPVAALPTAEQALQQCFARAKREEQSCALIAYGGVSSIGNPVVRERQQVCSDRRMSAEEHCLRMHKPSALQGVPARIPIQQPAQSQQIIIQKQTPLPVLPNTGPIIPGPTPYGR